ncbi:MAG: TonB family protein [Candidatus Electrothrix sp. Rat3]|nr:TonB family protein [Candidatus Electrothrix rattekaaiensis]
MNEAMQRMVPAALLTLALHGALLSSWRMPLPETERPKPLPQKISVSLKRLPPPPPPLKKIVQEVQALPKITATEHQPLRPLLPKPKPKPEPLKKIVQKAPALPKITRVQHQAARPLMLKPGRKISAVPQPLPKLAPVIRQAIKPLALLQPIKKPKPQYQQPIRRRTQPVRRTLPITRQAVSSAPVKTTTRPAPQASTGVVREAAPLYQSNPPPEYPRMAKRRGLEGLVTIEAKIDRNGRVEKLRIFASSGHSILDKAALKAVRAWRFSPGTVGGRAQSMWVKVPVRFELR